MGALVLVLEVVVFFAVTVFAAKGFSHLSAETYSSGAEPRGPFPVVSVRAPAPAPQYELVLWRELKRIPRKDPNLTFKLGEGSGRFVLPKDGDFEPFVEFTMHTANSGQIVEVTWHTDDYETTARYFTDGVSVQPMYLRRWGASTVLAGLIPGLAAGWFVGWVVRRRLRKRARAKP